MCDIAPFGMRCEYEDCDTLLCLSHRVNFALTELKQAFPLIGKYVDSYHCPDFKPSVPSIPKLKPNPNFIPPPTKKATPAYEAPPMPKTKPIKEDKTMEFVKAIKTHNRMCDFYSSKNECEKCPLLDIPTQTGAECDTLIFSYPELAEPILEQWDKEHPVRTRADKLRELFPNFKLHTDGFPEICPPELDCNLKCEVELSDCEYSETICNKCHRDFWTVEWEDKNA